VKWKKVLDVLPNKKTKLTAIIMAIFNGLKFAGIDIPDEIIKFVNDVGIPALAFFLWLKIDREANGVDELHLSRRSW
jgi:hypothetical protein